MRHLYPPPKITIFEAPYLQHFLNEFICFLCLYSRPALRPTEEHFFSPPRGVGGAILSVIPLVLRNGQYESPRILPDLENTELFELHQLRLGDFSTARINPPMILPIRETRALT